MQKLDRMCMNRLMLSFFLLNVPPIARKIFPANLMALLAVTLFSVARRHHQILYVELDS